MPLTDALRDDILASVPSLRAFAISLSGNGDRADDLVQETLLRALANIDSFQPGSNLPAWLFTILRNLFRSDYRKRRREVEDADGSYADPHLGPLERLPGRVERVAQIAVGLRDAGQQLVLDEFGDRRGHRVGDGSGPRSGRRRRPP